MKIYIYVYIYIKKKNKKYARQVSDDSQMKGDGREGAGGVMAGWQMRLIKRDLSVPTT